LKLARILSVMFSLVSVIRTDLTSVIDIMIIMKANMGFIKYILNYLLTISFIFDVLIF
jgi:hypothetical protein